MISPPDVPRSPWERYGLAFSAVWLAFLVFPVVAVAQADIGWAARSVGLVAIAVFAVVYVHGFYKCGGGGVFGHHEPLAARYLAVLTALVVLVCAVGGTGAVGIATFLLSFSMFTLSLSRAFAVALAVLLVTVALPLATGRPEDLYLALIPLLVGLSTGALRVLIQRGFEHDAAAAEMSLVSERERVARDVHDVLGHSLTVVTAKAELAARLMATDPERAADEMRQVAALSREALGEVRHTVGGLRVARLGDEVASARSALDAAGIGADVHGEVVDVDPRHRPVLAWVLRELVTNVVRHSGASRCEVRLATDGVTVLDDGRGCPAGAEGNGLRGVRERLAATGGVLVLTRTDPGTRAEVRL